MTEPFVLQIDTRATATAPLYRQILDGMRTALVDGVFPAGAQLPTVRELATDLGVHHNTVAEAYRLLAEEGWLELGRRRGAVVCKRAVRESNPKQEELFVQRLRSLVAEALSSGLSRKAAFESLVMVASKLKEI